MIGGKIVRALDVGYGNVKFVRGHESIEQKVICDMFPSRAPSASERFIGEGSLKSRDTVIVNVNGVDYEVGHDVEHAQGVNDVSSMLNKDFVKTDGYMARVLGALHYMFLDIPENYIDMLVVGLPVNSIKDNKEYLVNKLKGEHTLPDGRTIELRKIRVFEQPLGGFYNFMYSTEENSTFSYSLIKSQKTLIIDPGMFTFDWLLVDKMKGSDKRSGATNRSMSEIIKAVAKMVATERDTNDEQVFRILDEAIREGRTPVVFSHKINMDDYSKHTSNIINESVEALYSKVGDGADIDNIMLVGGGARFFLKAITKKYHRHQIITTNNAVYANVIGFQLAAERAYLKEQVESRKTSLVA